MPLVRVRDDLQANHAWQARLLAEFEALNARADEVGDPAWEADMARLTAELDRCTAQTREVSVRSRGQFRRLKALAYAVIAGGALFLAWVAWRVLSLRAGG